MPQQLNFDRMRHELEHAPEEYVLFGSSVMYLNGLRDEIGDVDMFVSPWLYSVLHTVGGFEEQTPRDGDPPMLEGELGVGVPVHAFAAWTQTDALVCVDACFRSAETVAGLSCIPLWLLRTHKRQALHVVTSWGIEVQGSRWEKHIHDLRRVEAALHGREIHQAIASAA